MKKSKKVLCILVAFLFVLTTVPFSNVFAKDLKSCNNENIKVSRKVNKGKVNNSLKSRALSDFKALNKKGIKGTLALAKSDWVKINKPKHKQVFYRGEKINTSAYVYDTWEDYNTIALAGFTDLKTDKILWADYSAYLITPDDYDEVYGPIGVNTKKLKDGKYEFGVFALPYDYSTDEVLDFDREFASVDIYLKTLKAPTKLKAKAGKRKVTLSFKKATGGKKYEIYRSTKKTKGYKKVKTTTSSKFTNKKLKKGKRYYYKVRTVRGSVKSSFTKPVRTPKVK
ncbi:hypothetical protein [Anaerofustis stercorihominis]|uniref:hypothetical protein n=1 Tax=Anaerofustis stercorihominis TaxID=214853 RepID=UPI00214B2EAC|nr:hypothetical protein [Anaerofustis stercorihominis]MCR2033610.1 hypothetical protein [Anaerofustis stercorihominis]